MTFIRSKKLRSLYELVANHPESIRNMVTREVFLLLLYMATAAMTLNVFMQTRSFEEGSQEFGLSVMLDGSADRPYVYRQLLPIVANSIVKLIPEEDRADFVHYHLDKYQLRQQYFGRAKYKTKTSDQWTPTYAIEFHIIYTLNFIALLGLAYTLKSLINNFHENNPYLSKVAPIIFLLALPTSFLHGNFFYDFIELFFLSTLLLTLIKGNFFSWTFLLPLAVLNKESNILVPILYSPLIFHYVRDIQARFTLTISAVTSAIVYFYIKVHFSQNTGGVAIWQLWDNIKFWATPKNYFLWHDFYIPMIPFPRGGNILLLGLLASLISISWKHTQNQIRKLLIIAALINTPLWLLFCHNDEMRNLSFIFIPLLLVVTQALNQLLNTRSPNISSEYPEQN